MARPDLRKSRDLMAARTPFVGLIGLLVLLIAGCDGGSGRHEVDAPDGSHGGDVRGGSDASADVAGPLGEPKPIAEGLAARLQATLDEYVAFTGEPGISMAVRFDDGRAWAGAAGRRELGADAPPMTVDSVFRVGSGTKPYVSTIVMQLVEEGALDLDAPLDEILPAPEGVADEDWEAITVRRLLQMQAGLSDYLVHPSFAVTLIAEPDKIYAPEELLDIALTDGFAYPPGEDCGYSNTNYVVLGLVIEAVLGRSFEAVLRERILEPLALEDTFLAADAEPIDRIARGYVEPVVIAELFDLDVGLLALLPDELWIRPSLLDVTDAAHPSFAWSAGSIVSSPRDMVRFMEALARGELVSEASLAEMREQVSCTLLGRHVRYGLGLFAYPTRWGDGWGHGGLNLGYQTSTMRLPDGDGTLSFMHHYLPQQNERLQEGLLSVLLDDAPGPVDACAAPEGFFATDGGPTLLARFSGPIASKVAAEPAPGIARVHLDEGGELTALYGIRTSAHPTRTREGDRVELTSLGPAAGAGLALRTTTISVAADAWDDLDQDGSLDLSTAAPGTVLVSIQDLEVDEVGDEEDEDSEVGELPSRRCITAVAPPEPSGTLYACEPDTAPEPGADLRLFANLPLETDPEEVQAILDDLGIARCTCPQARGPWQACPGPGSE